MGCPHEEGQDFPEGEDRPFCPPGWESRAAIGDVEGHPRVNGRQRGGGTIMRAACTLSRMRDGTWRVHHSSSILGTVTVSGPSREAALTKMRDELQYRSEWCPCSGASADTVELQVSDDPGLTMRP